MNYTPNEPPRAMSAAEIEKILPHRYPFALVDTLAAICVPTGSLMPG